MTRARVVGSTVAALLLTAVLPGCGTADRSQQPSSSASAPNAGAATPPAPAGTPSAPSSPLETVRAPATIAGEAARTVVVGPDVTQVSEDPAPANLREDLWSLRVACASQIGQVRPMTWTLYTGTDATTGRLARGTVPCDGEEHLTRLPRLPGSGVQVSLSPVSSAYAVVVPRP